MNMQRSQSRVLILMSLLYLAIVPTIVRASEANVTMDGHANCSLSTVSEDQLVAITEAVARMRNLTMSFERAVDSDIRHDSNNPSTIVHKRPLLGRNYWTVEDSWRQRFISTCKNVYTRCDVGDLYWAVHSLLNELEIDMGDPSLEDRLNALVTVRYKRIPALYEQIERAELALRKRNYKITGASYDVLTAEQQGQCEQHIEAMIAQLNALARRADEATTHQRVSLLEYRTNVTTCNGWYLQKAAAAPLETLSNELYRLHAVTDRAGVPSGLHSALSYVSRHVTGRIITDWMNESREKRIKGLLMLRDKYIPQAIALLRSEASLVTHRINQNGLLETIGGVAETGSSFGNDDFPSFREIEILGQSINGD